MKLESTLNRRPALLHLAPVFDVMALMVIFYLLGTNLVHHSGVAVDPPVSASQLPPLASAHKVLVTAGENPQVFFDREQLTFEAVIERLERKPDGDYDTVYLKVDRFTSIGKLMQLWDAAWKGGYKIYQGSQEPPKAATTAVLVPDDNVGTKPPQPPVQAP